MSIVVQRLKPGDEHLALRAALELKSEQERAGREPSLPHLQELLSKETNYLILASIDEELVGFLTAYQMPEVFNDASMIYLFEIEVLPPFRRLGIAGQMVRLLIQSCRGTSVEDIWVGTEVDNVAAIRLYESTGGVRQRPDICEFIYDLTNPG